VKIRWALAWGVAAVTVALLASCESPEPGPSGDSSLLPDETDLAKAGYFEPEDTYEGPTVPDISGNWQGSYYFDSYGKSAADLNPLAKRSGTPITAVITFNETNHTYVIITTSLSGRAHQFEGRLDAGGNMRLIDPYDGETWTTHRRRATTNLVEINDLVLSSELGRSSSQGLRTVLLDEHEPKPQESSSYFAN